MGDFAPHTARHGLSVNFNCRYDAGKGSGDKCLIGRMDICNSKIFLFNRYLIPPADIYDGFAGDTR